jgi:hypothetical protein
MRTQVALPKMDVHEKRPNEEGAFAGIWTFCLLDFAANLPRAANCLKQPGKQYEDAVPSET